MQYTAHDARLTRKGAPCGGSARRVKGRGALEILPCHPARAWGAAHPGSPGSRSGAVEQPGDRQSPSRLKAQERPRLRGRGGRRFPGGSTIAAGLTPSLSPPSPCADRPLSRTPLLALLGLLPHSLSLDSLTRRRRPRWGFLRFLPPPLHTTAFFFFFF